GEGLHFKYISPVNEPQWDWSNKNGEASQEGSPWSNADIHKVVGTLNAALEKKRLNTQILTPEAGMLTYLYGGQSGASNQIQSFFGDRGKTNLQNYKQVPRI